MTSLRLALMLPLFALACGTPEPSDDDTDTVDTDVETDDTDVETDDTDVDTDVTITDATIQDVRRNLVGYAEGDLLRITGGVVTGVKSVGEPRGFVVQDPLLTAFAGLFVGVDAAALPMVGDVVDVVGAYQEDEGGNAGAPAPAQTLTRLDVTAAQPLSAWTKTGTGALPNPVTVDLSDLSQAAETWESMRVRILDRTRLEVVAVFDDGDVFDVQRMDQDGSTRRVASMFRTLSEDVEDLAAGDSFALITGVLLWNNGRHVLGPVNSADLAGWEPADTDDTDVDTDETDTDIVDTDTDTDTGGLDTDETDTDTIDTTPFDTDTYVPWESGLDTDTDIDTTVTNTTTTNIHLGIHSPGQFLRVDDLVVTAVRYRVSPASTNAFVAQKPGLTERAGIYVYMAADTNLPDVGDIVDIQGVYEAWPAGAPTPGETLARLNVGSTFPNTGYWVISSGNPLPTPVEVTLADLVTPALGSGTISPAEKYESMLVHLTDTSGGFKVTKNIVSGAFECSAITGNTQKLLVEDEFFELTSAYSVSLRDTFTSVTGVVHHEVTAYKLAPTSAADITGWVDNP